MTGLEFIGLGALWLIGLALSFAIPFVVTQVLMKHEGLAALAVGVFMGRRGMILYALATFAKVAYDAYG